VLSWDELIEDALATVAFAGRAVPDGVEVVPLGHSVGGSIVLSSVIRKRLAPKRFAISSPALRVRQQVPAWKVKMGELLSSRLPSLAMSTGLDAKGISRDAAVVEAYRVDPLVHDRMSTRLYSEWTAANAEILARANEIRLPYFASHGADDPIIDPSGTQELFRRSGPPAGSRLEIYPGYLHEPFNEIGRERVYEDLAAWLLA
jgi:alpha-beta hydrolase superfamily lysophospholipase